MSNAGSDRTDAPKRMRNVALALAVICACFWLLFGLLSGIAAKAPIEEVAQRALCPGALFLATALFAWRWQAAGGILLFLEGALVLVGYPQVARSFCNVAVVMATMGVPPLVAGALLLIGWGRSLQDDPSRAGAPSAESPKA